MHALLSRRYYLINNVNAETRTTEQTILSRADSPPTDDGNKTYYKHKYYLVQQLSLSLFTDFKLLLCNILQTFWIEYMDEIAKQIGCKPDMTTIFTQDPKLALHCLFGPCFPSQYRLVGPGRWNGAKRAILGGMGRSLAPLSSNILPKNAKKAKIEDDNSQDICITVPKWLTSYFILFLIFFMLFCMLVV